MRDRSLGSTIRLYFTTHTLATGELVAPSAAFVAADFRIYKDGSATEKTTTNSVTVTSPFDSVVGTHLIEMDTGNNTGDANFWASGSVYRVIENSAKTVDGRDVSGVMIGEFSVEVQTADVRKFGGVVGTFAAGIPDAKVASIAANAITAVSIAADAITDAKVASDVTIASVTGSVGSVTASVTVGALNATAVEDIFSTYTLVESYAAVNTVGTPAQLLYFIQQVFSEFTISGTTITVKRLNNTTAGTFTMDSATLPTSRERIT